MSFARAWACFVIVVATFAVLTPLVPEWRGVNDDSFPLSWYPMFGKERPELENVEYVVGVQEDGNRVKIDTTYWTNGGMNQGNNELKKVLRLGVDERRQFCDRVAEKVARQKSRRMRAVVEVQILGGKYSRKAYFTGDHEPVTEKLRTSCSVPR